MNYAPVLVTVYHRLYTLRRCVEALRRNAEARETCLYIASDAPYRDEDVERVEEVRSYVNTITGFKSVVLIARERNLGQHDNCEDAINRVLDKHGRVIFLEDDILVSPTYLSYSNAALEAFDQVDRVFAVCGYNASASIPRGWSRKWYALNRYSPWGVAFWRDKWRKVDLSRGGHIDYLKSNAADVYKRLCEEDPALVHLIARDDEGAVTAMDARIECYVLGANKCCVYPIRAQTTLMSTGDDAMHCRVLWNRLPKLECDQYQKSDFSALDDDVKQDANIYNDLIKKKYPGRACRIINGLRNSGAVPVVRYFFQRACAKFGIK